VIKAKKIVAGAIATAALLALPVSGWAGELIVNGSFEDGPPVGGSFLTLPGGSTAMPGWTVTLTSVDIVTSGWQQIDGQRSLDMDGSPGPGGLEQTIATVPGQWYSVTMMMAGNMQCGPVPIKTLRVQAAGQVRELTFNTTGHSFADMGWEVRSWCFLATARQTTLAIISLSPGVGNCGAALDLVSVQEGVPPTPGDLNCDGAVGPADLAQLLATWGQCPAPPALCPADISNDGAVGPADLAQLLAHWG
jgi:choice-of-anchor C domain-containing protein